MSAMEQTRQPKGAPGGTGGRYAAGSSGNGAAALPAPAPVPDGEVDDSAAVEADAATRPEERGLWMDARGALRDARGRFVRRDRENVLRVLGTVYETDDDAREAIRYIAAVRQGLAGLDRANGAVDAAACALESATSTEAECRAFLDRLEARADELRPRAKFDRSGALRRAVASCDKSMAAYRGEQRELAQRKAEAAEHLHDAKRHLSHAHASLHRAARTAAEYAEKLPLGHPVRAAIFVDITTGATRSKHMGGYLAGQRAQVDAADFARRLATNPGASCTVLPPVRHDDGSASSYVLRRSAGREPGPVNAEAEFRTFKDGTQRRTFRYGPGLATVREVDLDAHGTEVGERTFTLD